MITARKTRGFSRGLLGAVLLCGLCGSLAAAPYSGGAGTSNAPYQLGTAADLATLIETPIDWDKWFILTANLDLQSTPVAVPIGNRLLPFTGVFDGAGHSVRGLAINDSTVGSKPLGLFGVLGAPAVVERLRLLTPGVRSAGNMSVGVLAGEVAQGATIQQCSTEQGTVSTPSSDAAGGLVGDNGGTVRECYSTTAVTGLGLAGGLAGRSTGRIEDCAAAAAVTTLKQGTGTAVGGLLGADVNGVVVNCFANAPSISGMRPAGLVGYAAPASAFMNCVCNKTAAKAVENWPADMAGAAWCEDVANLASQAFFTGLGWDFRTVWYMDPAGDLRLQWMSGGPIAVIQGPSAVVPDPATGLATVALDGSQSSDPNGAALKYTWTCLTGAGGPTDIQIDSVANPTVRLPVGTYRIDLVVNNGRADSAPASLTVTVWTTAAKDLPTAVILGPTGVVRPDPATALATITLDGSASSDPDRRLLEYKWRCLTPSGAATGISIGAVVRPTVILPLGTYRIELVVNNGTADSVAAVLTVIVNGAPTAVIRGPAGVIAPDAATGYARIILDGSPSSDPEKDPLKYAWRCLTPAGGPTGITIEAVVTPTVSLPAGTYRIELTVNDGAGDSAPFTLSLTVGGTNRPPTAAIRGPTGAVQPDPATGFARVTLDGSLSSDPDQDPLKYAWRCLTSTGGPTGITINAVVAPTVNLRAGTYRIELVVNDGKVDSLPAVLTIIVAAGAGPTAVARGPSGIVRPDPATRFARVALDGSASSDPDHDSLRYTWRCLTPAGAPTGIAIDAVVNPSVNLPVGTYRIELTVSDGKSNSAPAVISVAVNTAPTARMTGPYEVSDNGTGKQQVQLDGSKSSDLDAGQSLAYSWTCAAASPPTASGPKPVMVFPVGTHTVLLVVSDGVESVQITTTVVVRSPLAQTRTAASPSTIGRTSEISSIEFYLLLPAGKSVADVDPQAPIVLEINGVTTVPTRDPTYDHKKRTVAAYVATHKVLDMAGPGTDSRLAQVNVRLKTGETVSGTVNLEIVPGSGPSPFAVLAERYYYYLDTETWQ